MNLSPETAGQVEEVELDTENNKIIPIDSKITKELEGIVNINFEHEKHDNEKEFHHQENYVGLNINKSTIICVNKSLNDAVEIVDNDKSTKKICKRFIGILFALIAAISFSLAFVVTKLIPNLHPITQTIWGQLVNTIISIIVILGIKYVPRKTTIKGGKDRSDVWKGIVDVDVDGFKIQWKTLGKLIAVAIVMNVGLLSKVTALNYLSIADATVMKYLSLIFILAMTHFILHEKCLFVQSFSAGLIIAGAFIIARPPFLTGEAEFDRNSMIGLGIKILEGLSSAFYYIGMKKLRCLHFASTILIVNLVGLLMAILASTGLGLFKTPETNKEILLLIALGVCTVSVRYSLLLALKFERASTVSLIRCADVPFAFVFQIFIFGLVPGIWTLIGTLFVATGVLIVSFSKLIAELPKESRIRVIFGFLVK